MEVRRKRATRATPSRRWARSRRRSAPKASPSPTLPPSSRPRRRRAAAAEPPAAARDAAAADRAGASERYLPPPPSPSPSPPPPPTLPALPAAAAGAVAAAAPAAAAAAAGAGRGPPPPPSPPPPLEGDTELKGPDEGLALEVAVPLMASSRRRAQCGALLLRRLRAAAAAAGEAASERQLVECLREASEVRPLSSLNVIGGSAGDRLNARARHSSFLEFTDRMLQPPTTHWAPTRRYCCFLSFWGESGSDTWYLRDLLQRMLGCPVFLDSSG